MKYGKEFRKNYSETIEETDNVSDILKYCEWLEEGHARLKEIIKCDQEVIVNLLKGVHRI